MEVTQTHKLNLAILETELMEEVWHKMFWGGMVGFTTGKPQKNGQQAIPAVGGNPIEVVRSFVDEGRDNMLIPFEARLTGNPVFGDTQVKGSGEEQSLRYVRAYINQWRKAAMKFSGRMSNQRVKMYNFPDRVKPALMRWYAEYLNAMITQAFYKGASENLTAGTNDDGLGLKVRYHPNMYAYSATGVFTAMGTEFKNKTAAEVNTGFGTTADTAIDAAFFRELGVIAQINRWNQIKNENGDSFWLLAVHPYIMAKIQSDTTIVAAQNAAYNAQLMKHPAINGRQMLYYNGFCIVSDVLACRSWIDTTNGFGQSSTTDGFGRTINPWLLPPVAETNKTYACLLIGEGALAFGMGGDQDLYVTAEKDDHDNVEEIAIAQISGVNRTDVYASADESTVFNTGNATETVAAAYTAENTSSAIIAVRG